MARIADVVCWLIGHREGEPEHHLFFRVLRCRRCGHTRAVFTRRGVVA